MDTRCGVFRSGLESAHLDEPRLQHLLPAMEALHVGARAAEIVDGDYLRYGIAVGVDMGKGTTAGSSPDWVGQIPSIPTHRLSLTFQLAGPSASTPSRSCWSSSFVHRRPISTALAAPSACVYTGIAG